MKRPIIPVTLALLVLLGAVVWMTGLLDPEPQDTAPDLVGPVRTGSAEGVERETEIGGGELTSKAFDEAIDEERKARETGGVIDAFTARIVGKVVGPEGAPLPEATVTLHADRSSMPAHSQVGEALETVESDGSGRFGFDVALPSGRLIVIGRHPEYVGAKVSGIDPRRPGSLTPILKLGGGHAVSGRVTHTDGRPVEGASIKLYDLEVQAFDPEDKVEREGVSDRMGEFALGGIGPGIKRLVASAPGFSTRQIGTVRVPDACTGLQVVLGDGLAVMGRVVEEGTRAPAAEVRVLGRLRGGGGEGVPRGGVPSMFTSRTDANGNFILDGLPEGAVEIWAQGPGYKAGERRTVQAGTRDLVLSVDAPIRVSGRVVRKEDGTPIERFRIMASPSPDYATGVARPVLVEDEEGRFTLDGLAAWPELWLLVETAARPQAQHGPLRLEAGAAETGLEVRVGRGAILRGVVQDLRGDPVAGATVEATTRFGGDSAGVPNPFKKVLMAAHAKTHRTETDENGVYVLEGLSAGGWDLVARSPTRTSTETVGVELPEEGEVLADPLLVEPAGALVVRVRDEEGTPDGRARLRLLGLSHDRVNREEGTNASGEARFDGLPPGQYRVLVFQRGGQVDFAGILGAGGHRGGSPGHEFIVGPGQTVELDL